MVSALTARCDGRLFRLPQELANIVPFFLSDFYQPRVVVLWNRYACEGYEARELTAEELTTLAFSISITQLRTWRVYLDTLLKPEDDVQALTAARHVYGSLEVFK